MRISQSSFLKTLLAVAAITLVTAACAAAATLPMESSPEIPAAEGHVHMKVARNQNTQIDLVVKHLAPPDRIAPGTSVYRLGVADRFIEHAEQDSQWRQAGIDADAIVLRTLAALKS